MDYQVVMLQEAEDDVFGIYQYILFNDSQNHAERVIDNIEGVCARLANMPQRGHVPVELEWLGVSTYREAHFKPYRVIYEIDGRKVYVHAVLDGRRDLLQLLEERLLR